MTEWLQVLLIAVIVVLLLEARISIGVRLAVMETNLKWLIANLKKWGLVAPEDSSEQNK